MLQENHFAVEGETDDSETNTSVSYFNSNGYKAFKQECLISLDLSDEPYFNELLLHHCDCKVSA